MNFRVFLFKLLVDLPRAIKTAIVCLVDITLCFLSTWIAFFFRLGDASLVSNHFVVPATFSAVVLVVAFMYLDLYKAILRFTGSGIWSLLSKPFFFYTAIFSTTLILFPLTETPRTVGFIQPLVLFWLIANSRLLVKNLIHHGNRSPRRRSEISNFLIYGAGDTGQQAAKVLGNNPFYRVLGFIDDDIRLKGQKLNGISIHSRSDLESLLKNNLINTIFIAIPSLRVIKEQELREVVQHTGVRVTALPSFEEFLLSETTVQNLTNDFTPDNLLTRDIVEPHRDLMTAAIKGKTVLITGAGGSIGSELCRQIIELSPHKLLLFDVSEYALYLITEELKSSHPRFSSLYPIMGSVQDESTVDEIFCCHKPDTVIHTAAYKHVPLVDKNILAAIKNNIIGTQVVLDFAVKHGSEHFVLISSDKAVNPTTLMGATKRVAELMTIKKGNGSHNTIKTTVVRFGNVLNSSGSVIPLFAKQVCSGGPVTVRHPEVTRYFMAIPEAAQLVLQAMAISDGKSILILDMGQPVKILDLAKKIIEIMGHTIKSHDNPDGSIEIKYTGLEPTEKLVEQLYVGDSAQQTNHPKILKIADPSFARTDFEFLMAELLDSIHTDKKASCEKLLFELAAK